jgi:hypothetical protein
MGASTSNMTLAEKRAVNKSTIINVWNNNGTTKNYFWTDTLIKVFVEAPAATVWTVIYEYYTSLWNALFFVLSFPFTFIIAIAQDWSLSKVSHSVTVEKYGLSFIQYFLINNIDKVIQYHWMVWGSDYSGATRFFYMWLRWLTDIGIALTGVIGLTIGMPLNLIFWLFTFILWGDETTLVDYLKYLGFPNGNTKFYKFAQTFDTLTGN